MSKFVLTERQEDAQVIASGQASNVLFFGGSRSGKTALHIRNTSMRALKAKKSRHAVLRFRMNAVVSSVVEDTFPKVMELAFPQVDYKINRSLWYATLQNDSEIWFGGLDDKERTEKILGNEYVTILLNEISQIPYQSVGIAKTRLAQKCMQVVNGKESILIPRMYYDCNPPNRSHWSYKLFIEKINPETKKPLDNPDDYDYIQLNPEDNAQNLTPGYLDTLKGLSAAQQRRFLLGEFGDDNPNQLFKTADLDRWRVLDSKIPDMVRIVVAVDPSGSDDVDNADNDEIGIVIAGLGTDGAAYIFEDNTIKAGPATWGRVAVTSYGRHRADAVVGETNYGGAMVGSVIQTAAKDQQMRVNFKKVTASRGKVVRAEPFSALCEQGKLRLIGYFPELEEELAGFSTHGYVGNGSPNRADAMIWALAELFPAMVKAPKTMAPIVQGFTPLSSEFGY